MSSQESQSDCFKPPAIPTEVVCLHCRQEYESYLIHWVEHLVDGRVEGFWCCPTPNCTGRGFGFDILPTDPEYRDEDGELMWEEVDDDEDEEDDDEDDLFDEVMEDLDDLFTQRPPQDDLPPRRQGDEDLPF